MSIYSAMYLSTSCFCSDNALLAKYSIMILKKKYFLSPRIVFCRKRKVLYRYHVLLTA
ncbi:hypothetical protein PICMEDRAFT_125280 [Pichia membranifaciens NRRL Y-2026]|uniref:Uncharacterized protein n=1 Tax=Pichia membranifaciens NRRL Y-2026 TaxID=763406 RepID=A0A1E3NQ66_9ASCO|nr:hypothetical protein PICMEDRAFT_125280 [Pichia membranifaciens NRRL Y-2026]ODQ48240.1 hypothetical protein PICMEDRAFT_125280 [Pichia membranifaciens NRRL Y-2026]